MAKIYISESEKNHILKSHKLPINENIEIDDIVKGNIDVTNKNLKYFIEFLNGNVDVSNIANDIESYYDLNIKKDVEKDIEKDEVSTDIKKYGKIKYKGSLSGDQQRNMNLIIKEMEKEGITDPFAQIAILAIIKRESNFKLLEEIGYCNTPDSRIVSIFGKNRGEKCKSLKCNDAQFFDCIYGYKSGLSLGNTQPGDGYKYIGRGFHGLTGKANYKKYGVSNPESLSENPAVAAEEVVNFFKDKVRKFSSVKDAVRHFNNVNTGGTQFGLDKALDNAQLFEIV